MRRLFGIFAVLVIFISCNIKNTKTNSEIIVFHAGSLSVPMREIEKEFEKQHPNIDVKLEAGGSISMARRITDLKRPCDVFASADYHVIDEILIPNYTNLNIKFATNEIVIVFTDKSHYSTEINVENCFDILCWDDVNFGRSDPNTDPCGYRSVLAMKLAEKIYAKSNLSNTLQEKDIEFVRPKASDLIALLEINAVDYIFEYKSVAVQNGFKYISLSDSVNLSNPNLNDWYKTAQIEINGKTPGEKVTIEGQYIVYGITILNDSPNHAFADTFMRFVLKKENGLSILEENGQGIIYPAIYSSYN